MQAPYHPVKNGVVDKNPRNVKYLNAFEEERFLIAQANTEIDQGSSKLVGRVTCRFRDQVSEYDPNDVEFMDVSPKQVVSVAAGINSISRTR